MRAVIFDMDGTLVDTEPHWLSSETELMARFGYTWTPADQANCLGGPIPKVGRIMSELSGNQQSGEYFASELVSLVLQKFATGIHFMPGAFELLKECKTAGVALALVTASPRELVDSTLALFDEEFFSVSVSKDDVKESKPHPEGYLKAARQLGIPIAECLVLEDSLTGVTAGQRSGAVVVAIPHLNQIPPHPRTVCVDSLSGISLQNLQSFYLEMADKK